MESSPERRISAVVAIVGDDERLASAIERALRSRGASAVSISVEKLVDDPPPHDLVSRKVTVSPAPPNRRPLGRTSPNRPRASPSIVTGRHT